MHGTAVVGAVAVSEHYVESVLAEAALNPDASAILFRMHCLTCYAPLLPQPNVSDFRLNYAGISFAVRRSLLKGPDGLAFNSGCAEDYELLHTIRKKGFKVVIAPELTYFVKGIRPKGFPALPALGRAIVQWDEVERHSTKGDVNQSKECTWQYDKRRKLQRKGRPNFVFPWGKDQVLLKYFRDNMLGLAGRGHRALRGLFEIGHA